MWNRSTRAVSAALVILVTLSFAFADYDAFSTDGADLAFVETEQVAARCESVFLPATMSTSTPARKVVTIENPKDSNRYFLMASCKAPVLNPMAGYTPTSFDFRTRYNDQKSELFVRARDRRFVISQQSDSSLLIVSAYPGQPLSLLVPATPMTQNFQETDKQNLTIKLQADRKLFSVEVPNEVLFEARVDGTGIFKSSVVYTPVGGCAQQKLGVCGTDTSILADGGDGSSYQPATIVYGNVVNNTECFLNSTNGNATAGNSFSIVNGTNVTNAPACATQGPAIVGVEISVSDLNGVQIVKTNNEGKFAAMVVGPHAEIRINDSILPLSQSVISHNVNPYHAANITYGDILNLGIWGYKMDPSKPAAQDCIWGPWSAWEACRDGKAVSRREIATNEQNGGKPCNSSDKLRFETCADCVMSPWAEWSACDASGGGVRSRFRTIIQSPVFNGVPCGNTSETEYCAVNCTVSEWGAWSPCNNMGGQYRTRAIMQLPINGGTVCPELAEARTCGTDQAALELIKKLKKKLKKRKFGAFRISKLAKRLRKKIARLFKKYDEARNLYRTALNDYREKLAAATAMSQTSTSFNKLDPEAREAKWKEYRAVIAAFNASQDTHKKAFEAQRRTYKLWRKWVKRYKKLAQKHDSRINYLKTTHKTAHKELDELERKRKAARALLLATQNRKDDFLGPKFF